LGAWGEANSFFSAFSAPLRESKKLDKFAWHRFHFLPGPGGERAAVPVRLPMAADSTYSSVSRPLHIPGVPIGTLFLLVLATFNLPGWLFKFIFTHGNDFVLFLHHFHFTAMNIHA